MAPLSSKRPNARHQAASAAIEHTQTVRQAVLPNNFGAEWLDANDSPGEAGMVLVSQGPGREPTWAPGAAGGSGAIAVIDALNSTSTTAALSANQGRILNDAMALAGHITNSKLSLRGRRLAGNSTGSLGPLEEIGIGSGLDLSSGTLKALPQAGVTNLSVTGRTGTQLVVSSDTGSNAVLVAATPAYAGLLSNTDKSKLDGIAAGATANLPDEVLLDLTHHVGTLAGSQLSGLYTQAGLRLSSPQRLLGRSSYGPGPAEELRLGNGLELIDGMLSATAAGESAGTDLFYNPATRLLISSTGGDVTLPLATASQAGLMAAADKDKLDRVDPDAAAYELPIANNSRLGGVKIGTGISIMADGTINVAPLAGTGTDLSYDEATRLLQSSSGADVTLPLATGLIAGLMTSADKTKLDGISTGGTANQGTVTEVSGGAGLVGLVTGTGSLEVGAGLGIRVNADDVAIDRGVTDGWYASTAQGALAESALQSGAPISSLTNDAGYTANSGTVVQVSGAGGLAGTVTTSGELTIDRAATDGWYLPRDIRSLPVLP